MDIGTGDGRFVSAAARANPNKFYIGIDANAKPLEKISMRATRKVKKGGLPNAMFVQAAVEDLPAEFDAAAFSLPVNEYSEPVQTSFGWHILQVMQRREAVRTEAEMEQARADALTEWLETQKTATLPDGRPLVELFDTWRDHVPDRPSLPTTL